MRKGSNFRALIEVDGLWYNIPGERTTVGKITNEGVDSTNKDDLPWRSFSPCGILIGEITFKGVKRTGDEVGVFARLVTASLDGSAIKVKIESVRSDDTVETILESFYIISSLMISGEYNSFEGYNITFSGNVHKDVIDPNVFGDILLFGIESGDSWTPIEILAVGGV